MKKRLLPLFSRFSLFSLLLASVLWSGSSPVFAHTSAGHSAAHDTHGASSAPDAAQQMPFGIAGQAAAVRRTITLKMSDDMRFSPRNLTLAQGETVRLRVQNNGQVMHEIVLGTSDSLAAHEKAMREHPDMAHDAPYMAHVAPSQQGELIWQFNRPGTFDFACLVAGHYAAGMKGRITVTPAAKNAAHP